MDKKTFMNPHNQKIIPKRSATCALGGEKLQPGMEITSQILEEGELVSRQDYCSACWNQYIAIKNASKEAKIYWKSRIETKKSASSPSLIQQCFQLFKELLHNNSPHESEIFVLSLLLSRAKQILLRKEFNEEKVNYQLFEDPKTESFYTVKVIPLSDHELETIHQSLSQKLCTNHASGS